MVKGYCSLLIAAFLWCMEVVGGVLPFYDDVPGVCRGLTCSTNCFSYQCHVDMGLRGELIGTLYIYIKYIFVCLFIYLYFFNGLLVVTN